MLTKRIIACLDMEAGRVVKGVRFRGLADAGDPLALAADYCRQGIDEIVFLDVGATPGSRDIMVEVLERVSAQIFIPLTVGGGLRSLADMRRVLRAGADKISLCSAALAEPGLISRAAATFGSQCVVISIDCRRQGRGWQAYSHGGRRNSGRCALAWAEEACRLGAGEVLLNSIDGDGTGQGYDLELLRRVSRRVDIPVIASGGAGRLAHIAAALTEGEADAVLAASLFHFRGLRVAAIKRYLKKRRIPIR